MKKLLEILGIRKNNADDVEHWYENIDPSAELNFEWITKKWVRSNKGFEVKMLGRHEMEYCEPGKLILKVECDVGLTAAMKPCVIVSSSEFSRASDREEQVKKNFVDALKFQEMEVSFE